MDSETYDYIICGGGCAGLSLALRLCDAEFSNKKTLVLDKSSKTINDRTWSFWAKPGENRFEHLCIKSWPELAFLSPGFEVVAKPSPYQYHTIRGIDFYRNALENIDKSESVNFRNELVEEMNDHGDHVQIKTEKNSYKAKFVFDSIVKKFPEDHHLFVWQHFMGWEIELNHGEFNDNRATFMDFRIDQQGETIFVYVLPFSRTNALVEVTFFSREILGEETYTELLATHISKYISNDYEILNKEFGAIPMTTSSFSVGTKRIIPIGTNNGTVKPSSGYAFMRIQKECEILIDRIKTNSIRRVLPRKKYLAYDRTLLNVITTGKEEGREVFRMMFERNPMLKILKFLNEETSLLEEVRIFSTLPFWSFLRAFVKENVFRLTFSETISKP